jgi:hypothetical protein
MLHSMGRRLSISVLIESGQESILNALCERCLVDHLRFLGRNYPVTAVALQTVDFVHRDSTTLLPTTSTI